MYFVMNYKFTVDLQQKTINLEMYERKEGNTNSSGGTLIANAKFNTMDMKDKNTVLAAIRLDAEQPLTLQDFDKKGTNFQDLITQNLSKAKGNLLKLNLALSTEFDEMFQKNYENKMQEAINIPDNSNMKQELSALQAFAAFFYTVKRAIAIAYTLIVVRDNVTANESQDVKELQKTEAHLKQLLNDSVKLVLNTNEFIETY